MLFQGRHRGLNNGLVGRFEVNFFWKVALVVVIPALVALFGGVWLAMRTVQGRNQHVEAGQLREVTAQVRSLSDLVMGEIDQVRTEARAIQKVHEVQAAQDSQALAQGHSAPIAQGAFQEAMAPFFSEIFYWAEFDYDSAGVKSILRSMKKPGWQEAQSSAYAASINDTYLLGALKNLDLDSLRQSGTAILRFKQEPSRNNEWLALIFDETSGGGKALVALVDPATAFPVFEQWGQRSEGGALRAYLIGSDGYVLSHSKSAYTAADFSRTSLFRDSLRFLFTRERLSGSGTFRAIDETQVVASYQRPGSLPLGVVVEKVKNVPAGALPGGVVQAKSELQSIPMASVLSWAGLWVAAWLWAVYVIQRILVAMRPKTTFRNREAEAEDEEAWVEGPRVDALVQNAAALEGAQKAQDLARKNFSDAVARGDLPKTAVWEETPVSKVPSPEGPKPTGRPSPKI